jgi:hypothetical protein
VKVYDDPADKPNIDWGDLPAPGTRVRVPHLTSMIEGEVILRYRIFGRPVARVQVEIPISHDPYETREVHAAFSRHEMEVISD